MGFLRDTPEGPMSILIGVALVVLGCIVSLYDQDWRWLITSTALAATFTGWTYLIAWLYQRRRGERPPWACQRCGYDRRGLPLSAVCPECGGAGGGEDAARPTV